MTRNIVFFIFFAAISTASLAGCGIKPGTLPPPEGSDNNTFPRTYPAPDPAE